jgi:hypothetical protein
MHRWLFVHHLTGRGPFAALQVLHEYCSHYNDERPHRSRNLRPPASRGDPIAPSDGQISRTVRLGGLLSEYRRVPVAA